MEIEGPFPASRMTQVECRQPSEPLRNLAAFWLLGLFNNAGRVFLIPVF
jgi:hypothetical protein